MVLHHLSSSLLSGGTRAISSALARSPSSAAAGLSSSSSYPVAWQVAQTSRRVLLEAAAAASDDKYYFQDEPMYPGSQESRKQQQYVSSQKPFFPKIKNQKQIGVTLVGLGAVFTLLGMLLFFEKNLLRIGNLSFLLGVALFVGPNNLIQFFSQPNRIRAAIIVLFGAFLVFSGSPRLGIICQIFGLLNLFGNMFPFVLVMLRQIPILGDFIGQAEEMVYGLRRKYKAQGRMGARAGPDSGYYDFPPSFQPKPSGSNNKYYSEF